MKFRGAGLLSVVLVAGGVAGCGGYTNENTPVKVVTDDEMRERAETNKRIAEMGGLKGGVVPAPKDAEARK
jgi:hypothetical protein